MKKIFIILIVISMVIFNFTGCTNKGNVEENPNNGTTNGTTDGGTNTNGNDIVGKLVGIDTEEIKLSVNGKTIAYKVQGDKVKDYYLGETIMLTGSDNNYVVGPYEKYNFDTRHTNEGELITRTTGTIKDINDKHIITTTDLGDISIMNPGNFNLPVNTNVIFDYVTTNEGNRLISFYDESQRMDLTVDKITRDNTGRMVIMAKDANGKEFEVLVHEDALLNVRHSTLKSGEHIKVYPTSIGDEKIPKVNANMIVK